MQIKELKDKYPLVYEAALKNKVEGDDTISIARAFTWFESPEKEYFWKYIYKKNFDKAKEICPHLFESKEEVKLEYKFKVGDQVKIVKQGEGCKTDCIGEIVTILELGVYVRTKKSPGYKTTPTKGNSNTSTPTDDYKGIIGEESFELYKPAESIVEDKKKLVFGLYNIYDWSMSNVELMPEGFNPDSITPEPTVQEENQEDWIPEVGDWIPKVGDWVVITKGFINWSDNMQKYVGKCVQITEVFNEVNRIQFQNDGRWAWYYTHGHFRKALPHEIPKEDNSVVSGFPEEGCFYGNERELKVISKYLSERPYTSAYELISPHKAIGVGWNGSSFWWLSSTTSKKLQYSLEQLKQFLPTSIITKEKTEKVDFIKGKWYRLKTIFDWYAKLLDFKDDEFTASEHIDIETSKIKKIGIWDKFIERGYTATLLTDLSEIQDYLPDGHPDKKDSTSNQVHVATYPQLENCKRADVLTPFDIEKIFSNELSKKKKNYEIQTRLVTTDFTFKKKPKKTILSI